MSGDAKMHEPMAADDVPKGAVDAAYDVLYGPLNLTGETRAGVRVAVAKALAAAGPHLLPDPGAKKLGPFVRESGTSRLAALAAYPSSNRNRRAVLAAVAGAGDRGMTRDEIADSLVMDPNTVRPRVAELRQGGWLADLVDSDGKAVRRPSSKRVSARVLVVSELGERRLAQRKG